VDISPGRRATAQLACPNIIRIDKDGADGCSNAISPWSAAVTAKH
jgi:gamma-glutamyltranspeptidase/glutathione hydrolase